MAATPPSDSKPAGDDRNLVPVNESTALSFEDKVNVFWQKHRGLVLGACVAVVVAIVAKGGWDYLARQKELEVERAYAATTPEQLSAFAAAHADHVLGAIAQLRMADDAYTAGKSEEAITGYDKALARLEDGPLLARAKIGRAMAKIQAGKTDEGKKEIAELANNVDELQPARAEATYHLASLAAAAGQAAEVQRLSDQLMQIDASSPWASRAMSLRANMPVTAASAPGGGAAPAAPANEAPQVELKLPGKK